MGNIYIDPIFQISFEAYSSTIGGQLALRADHFRAPLKPEHTFGIVGKISQDAWITYHDLFRVLDSREGIWSSVSKVAPSSFLTSSWAALMRDRRHHRISQEPVVQFFRHVRNAVSHDNRFNIEINNHKIVNKATKVLLRKAKWRGVEITPAMHDTVLFWDFMEVADPIWLVSDVSTLLQTTTRT